MKTVFLRKAATKWKESGIRIWFLHYENSRETVLCYSTHIRIDSDTKKILCKSGWQIVVNELDKSDSHYYYEVNREIAREILSSLRLEIENV